MVTLQKLFSDPLEKGFYPCQVIQCYVLQTEAKQNKIILQNIGDA